MKVEIETKGARIIGDIFSASPKDIVIIETSLGASREGIFTKFAEEFQRNGTSAFVYDKRAHNESRGTFSANMLVDDLLCIIDRFKNEGYKRFYLFGFCYGGITATIAAARRSEVKGLALVNTYGSYLDLEKKTPDKFSKRHAMFSIAQLLDRTGASKLLTDKERMMSINGQKTKGLRYTPRTIIRELKSVPTTYQHLERLRIPVLFIYSKKDHLVPFELMDQLFQKAKTKKMIFIDDSHFPNRNVELIAYHFSRAFIRDDFEALTPYGPNFRFYNKITKLTNKDIEGEMAFGKKLTKGHFVDVELVPGMFLIESAAQISSVLIRENIFQHEKYHVLLHKIGDVRFMKALKPEEKIRIRSELVSIEGPDYKVSCSIHHGGDIIAKMDMIAFCIPKEVLQKSLR